jgi:hypothetical protein
MDSVEDLLNEVARRLVAWSEPTLAPRSSERSSHEFRMAAQCSFFDEEEEDQFLSPAGFRRSLPLTLPPVRGAKRQEWQNRRQYAELHGRDTWNWDHA